MVPYSPLVFLVQCLLLSPISGALVNLTIDDTYGDSYTNLSVQYTPLYSPFNAGDLYWKNNAQCAAEQGSCGIMPSTDSAIDNTWTQTTYLSSHPQNISIGFSFSGVAIYVFLILTNVPRNTSEVSDVFCHFRLDGEIVGSFSHKTDETSKYQFNVLAYNQTNLEDRNHTMLIEQTGNQSSFIVFDYALYSTDLPVSGSGTASSPSASPSHAKSHAKAIAGGVVGALVGLGLVVMGVIYWRHRRTQKLNLITSTPKVFPNIEEGSSKQTPDTDSVLDITRNLSQGQANRRPSSFDLDEGTSGSDYTLPQSAASESSTSPVFPSTIVTGTSNSSAQQSRSPRSPVSRKAQEVLASRRRATQSQRRRAPVLVVRNDNDSGTHASSQSRTAVEDDVEELPPAYS